jgi:uncharacterized membrane protein YhaH (DUF805 family)
MTDDISDLKNAEKAPTNGREHSWIIGLVLILAGAIFLISNLTDMDMGNWWSFFILIPALGSFNHAWENYQQHGRLTGPGRSALAWGVFFTTLCATFFFDLNWDYVWPTFLILGGLAILLNSRFD